MVWCPYSLTVIFIISLRYLLISLLSHRSLHSPPWLRLVALTSHPTCRSEHWRGRCWEGYWLLLEFILKGQRSPLALEELGVRLLAAKSFLSFISSWKCLFPNNQQPGRLFPVGFWGVPPMWLTLCQAREGPTSSWRHEWTQSPTWDVLGLSETVRSWTFRCTLKETEAAKASHFPNWFV